MPKRKKHHKKMGAARSAKGAGMLIKLASVAVGYLAADKINDKLDKSFTPTPKLDANGQPIADTMTPNVILAGELGLGGLLMLKKMPVKNRMAKTAITVAGGVLVGAGLKRAMKKLGVIHGYQSVPVIGRHRMAGYQSVPVIGGVPNQLSGVPNQLTGGYIPSGSSMNGYKSQGSGVMGSMDPSGSGILRSQDFMG